MIVHHVFLVSTSSASSVSIFFGFLIQQLAVNAPRQITPNKFHVRYGPNGHVRGTSSSTPANSLHRNPATKGAKALAKEANPCATPFKLPKVFFDGAEFVIYVNA
jgi:hypothetical protein